MTQAASCQMRYVCLSVCLYLLSNELFIVFTYIVLCHFLSSSEFDVYCFLFLHLLQLPNYYSLEQHLSGMFIHLKFQNFRLKTILYFLIIRRLMLLTFTTSARNN